MIIRPLSNGANAPILLRKRVAVIKAFKQSYRACRKKSGFYLEKEKSENISGIRSLVGSNNYIIRFFPNLAKTMKPFRGSIKKRPRFEWDTKHEEVFERLKGMVIDFVQNYHFDQKKNMIKKVMPRKKA